MLVKIAIIGAGFAGLASAWHLSSLAGAAVTVYDPLPIGSGTSGLASGLLHAYPGRKAKRSSTADSDLSAALELLDAASEALGRDVYARNGLLRVASTESQKETFPTAAEAYSELEWWGPERCSEAVPGLQKGLSGLWIPSSIQVDCPLYLQGLWKACAERGAKLVAKAVQDLTELDTHDIVVLAAGYDSLGFAEQLPLRAVKGQLLYLKWPEGLDPLPFPVNSEGHLLMRPNGSCLAGATYERNWETTAPCPETAIELVREKVRSFFPMIDQMEPQSCHAGLRAFTPQHQPLVTQVSDRTWAIGALGSKGLIWHGRLARELAAAL